MKMPEADECTNNGATNSSSHPCDSDTEVKLSKKKLKRLKRKQQSKKAEAAMGNRQGKEEVQEASVWNSQSKRGKFFQAPADVLTAHEEKTNKECDNSEKGDEQEMLATCRVKDKISVDGQGSSLQSQRDTTETQSSSEDEYMEREDSETAAMQGDMPKDTPTQQGDTMTQQGDTPTEQGDTTTEQGDTTVQQEDTTTQQGDKTTQQRDTTTQQGDMTTQQGDTTIQQGDITTQQGDAATHPGNTETQQGETKMTTDTSETCLRRDPASEENPMKKKKKKRKRNRKDKEMEMEATFKATSENIAEPQTQDSVSVVPTETVSKVFQLKEEKGDLFACPLSESLALCVCQDLRMKKGTAKSFKNKFGNISELKAQGKRVGEAAVLKENDRYIYFLITRENASIEVKDEDLRAALESTKTHCQEHKVTSISMPNIWSGSGQWKPIHQMFNDVFRDTSMTITLYEKENSKDCKRNTDQVDEFIIAGKNQICEQNVHDATHLNVVKPLSASEGQELMKTKNENKNRKFEEKETNVKEAHENIAESQTQRSVSTVPTEAASKKRVESLDRREDPECKMAKKGNKMSIGPAEGATDGGSRHTDQAGNVYGDKIRDDPGKPKTDRSLDDVKNGKAKKRDKAGKWAFDTNNSKEKDAKRTILSDRQNVNQQAKNNGKPHRDGRKEESKRPPDRGYDSHRGPELGRNKWQEFDGRKGKYGKHNSDGSKGNKKQGKKSSAEESAFDHSSESQPFQFRQVQGNLFSCPRTESLAHCVSEDFHMGKGIAKTFKEMFDGVRDLKAQSKRVGEAAVLEDEGRYIYYLITKQKYFLKPTYKTLQSALEEMKEHCQAHQVTNLSIPQLACGLDQLNWNRVSRMLCELFKDTRITITVYSLRK